MSAQKRPSKRGPTPRWTEEELERAQRQAAHDLDELGMLRVVQRHTPPRHIRSARRQQDYLYEQTALNALVEFQGTATLFPWWLDGRRSSALTELGRLEAEFPGWLIAIALLLERAKPRGTMTAADAIRGLRLGLRRGRQTEDA